MKKGQNLSLSTLVVVVLILIVLFVTLVVFFKYINEGQFDLDNLRQCEKKGAPDDSNRKCEASCGSDQNEIPFKCPAGKICCETEG